MMKKVSKNENITASIKCTRLTLVDLLYWKLQFWTLRKSVRSFLFDKPFFF